MGAAVHKFWVAAVVAACVAPSAAANVVPRLTHLFAPTAAVWLEVAIVAGVIMSVLLMARVPFFIEDTKNWAWRGVAISFGLACAILNCSLAHETVGRFWDLNAAPTTATVAKRAALNSRMERAQTAAAQLPQLPQTSAAEVAAADQAVALAEADVAKECVIVKDNCRLRQGDLREAVAARGKVLAARSATEKREAFETMIETASKELEALGPVVKADASASRLAKQIGRWVDLGDEPDTTLRDSLISFFAVMIELMAFLGPKLVLTKRVDGDHRRWWRLPTWARRAHVQPNLSKNPEELPTTPPAPLPAAVEIVAIKTTAATTAKPKMLDVSRPAAVADANSVREWFKSRTAARAGVEIARKEVFTAYCSRCQEQGIESVSSRRFGEIMKGELGVQLIERRKNHFYVGIALVSAPRLVVASS